MDINKVKVLIYAVDNGSLLTAATKLGYTQAGLTHMMNSLESELVSLVCGLQKKASALCHFSKNWSRPAERLRRR